MTYPHERITYVSEQDKEYIDGLRSCKTLRELKAYLNLWRVLCYDAYKIVQKMNAGTWKEYKAGEELGTQKKYAGDEWTDKYSVILMPDILIRTSYVSALFKVPWGCAFIRLNDSGIIKMRKGVYVWIGE